MLLSLRGDLRGSEGMLLISAVWRRWGIGITERLVGNVVMGFVPYPLSLYPHIRLNGWVDSGSEVFNQHLL